MGTLTSRCRDGAKRSTERSAQPGEYDSKASKARRSRSIHHLAKTGGSEAVKGLARAAKVDPSADLRESAVVALGKTGRVEAIDALAEAARRDANFHVRRRAVEALGFIRHTRSAVRLAELWLQPKTSADSVFNIELKQALIRLGPLAVLSLRRSLTHPSWKVRLRVVDALAQVGDLTAIEDLRARLKDTRAIVADAAQRAIQTIQARARKR